ncbi:hypothetical protein [Rubritalea tangerina]|uniref:Uncharacterized protein n=1 Tax=Rubritalea tangerina TaxID=430798 RepID=A0ABW4ZEV8_9BACT
MRCILVVLAIVTLVANGYAEVRVKTGLSVVMFEGGAGIDQLYWREADQAVDKIKEQSVLVSYGALDYPTEYSGSINLELGTLRGEEYQSVAKCVLPKGSAHVLVFLFPANSANGTYQAQAFDVSLDEVPVGARMVINASSKRVRALYGKSKNDKWIRKFEVAPKRVRVVVPVDKGDPALTGRRIYGEYFDQEAKGWEKLLSTRWYHTPDRRNYVVIFDSKGTPRPNIRYFSGVPIRGE